VEGGPSARMEPRAAFGSGAAGAAVHGRTGGGVRCREDAGDVRGPGARAGGGEAAGGAMLPIVLYYDNCVISEI
jgi:hypothetical protein